MLIFKGKGKEMNTDKFDDEVMKLLLAINRFRNEVSAQKCDEQWRWSHNGVILKRLVDDLYIDYFKSNAAEYSYNYDSSGC